MTRDGRIDQLLALVLELANGNLDARLDSGSRSEPLDGVIEGLNMLAEELSASTAALKRSEESFRSLIERSPDAIFVHRQQRFVYVNAAALALLGHGDPSELSEDVLSALVCAEGVDVERGVRASTPPMRECALTHERGTKVSVEVVSIPVNFGGQPATLSIARDISARKELIAKMMEMDRMIAVGTLAAGVGHEINNPLAYVISNLDLALDTLGAADKSRRAGYPGLSDAAERTLHASLAEAREGSERVRQIVRDLRTFSSMQATPISKFELRPVIDSAIQVAFNEIRHRAQLVREYDRVPLVEGHPSRLGQVFLNLLVNAAHAIPIGAASEHRITVRTSCSGGQVRVAISDTGVGIEPEHLSRLFDPFFTTKPVGQGTGLGLFICKRIVHEHDGELEVESKRGGGTTFRVVLPACERVELVDATRELTPVCAAPRARVLVVDDEPGIARSLARALARDHDVSTVTSAREALKRLREGDSYDAVLCDVMMPEMTGVDLYRELTRLRPEFARRMLFFTGGAFTPATQEFVQRMGERCLEKPFDVGEVRRKLASLFAS